MGLMISKRIPVQLLKSGFILPNIVGDAFVKSGHKRVLLKAFSKEKTVETHVALRYIQEAYRIYFGQRHQKNLEIVPLDIFEVQLIEDTSKYGVEAPEAFKAVLQSDPDAAAVFDTLTDGKKRGIIYQIKRYKSEQTQVDKTLIIFENLKKGIRDSRDLLKP